MGALIAIALFAAMRSGGRRRAEEADAAERARQLERQIAELSQLQTEMTGRVQTMADVFGARQSDLARALGERLDKMSHRLGQSMSETTRHTQDNLQKLHERLAVIDRAQRTITDLSGHVIELQGILSNKQARGAFGQARMEAIVSDGLPSGAYVFQARLSNESRPDCLISFPNDAPALVVDAKFPLEGYNAIRDADTPDADKAAQAQFRKDMAKHITDISDKYLIPGETQDTAFLFVPSESVFAELHENFEDVVQRAHRARVVIVSPSLLLLSIQVIQAILRDVRMREQAHLIQNEVAKLMDDVGRLDKRVAKLQSHFQMATRDIEEIVISTGKIKRQGGRIEDLDLGEIEEAEKPSLVAGG